MFCERIAIASKIDLLFESFYCNATLYTFMSSNFCFAVGICLYLQELLCFQMAFEVRCKKIVTSYQNMPDCKGKCYMAFTGFPSLVCDSSISFSLPLSLSLTLSLTLLLSPHCLCLSLSLGFLASILI